MSAAPPIDYSADPTRVQVDRVHAWLRASYWSPGLRREVFDRALAHSLAYSAFVDGIQVGFARVVTDQATFAWLCDVYVDEAVRGRGVARGLVQRALADPRLATIRRMCLATLDAHGVYAPLGFALVPAARWMERLGPKAAWSDEVGP